MGTRASRKARGSRDAQIIALRYEPSSRELFPELDEAVKASRPIVAWIDEGTPQERVEYGAPTYRNVGEERPRTPKPERKHRTQTARRRVLRRPVRPVADVAPEPLSRKALKRAGVKLLPAPKAPTPPMERSHTWRSRINAKNRKAEFRPSRIALVRYGVRDLGWQPAKKYMTKAGKLTKAAKS